MFRSCAFLFLQPVEVCGGWPAKLSRDIKDCGFISYYLGDIRIPCTNTKEWWVNECWLL